MVDFQNLVAWRLFGQEQAAQKQKVENERIQAEQAMAFVDKERQEKDREFQRQLELYRAQGELDRGLGRERTLVSQDPRLEQMGRLGASKGDLVTKNAREARQSQITDARVKFDRGMQEKSFDERVLDERLLSTQEQQDEQNQLGRWNEMDMLALRLGADADQASKDRWAATQRRKLGLENKPEKSNRGAALDLRNLGKELRKFGDLKGQMDVLAGALNKKQIPGVGRVEGTLASYGFGGADAIQTRQASQQLHNALQHAISGGAVTPTEADRNAIATGLAPYASEQQWRLGVAALIRNMSIAMTNIEAGYDSSLVDIYESQGGTTSRNFLPPTPKMQEAPNPKRIAVTREGMTRYWNPDTEQWED